MKEKSVEEATNSIYCKIRLLGRGWDEKSEREIINQQLLAYRESVIDEVCRKIEETNRPNQNCSISEGIILREISQKLAELRREDD